MTKAAPKSTILVISMGFLALHLVFSWEWAVWVSLATGAAGIISPFLSNKIDWVWTKLAIILGYIVPNVFLAVVFFLLLFPLSLLSKLFTKDPLMLSRKYDSYFINVNKKFDKRYFEKIW